MIAVVSLLLAGTMPVAGAPAEGFPQTVSLPDGSYPEGIAVGRGHDFYVGSMLNGALYKGDLRTGDGSVLAPGVTARVVAGLYFDRRSGLVWAAGAQGSTPKAYAFDGNTGRVVVDETIPGVFLANAFPNDVVVTRDAVYLTNTFGDELWTIPLTRRGLPAGPVAALPLTGDFTFVGPGDVPPGTFPANLNGIDVTPDGEFLLANHTVLGVVYRIDPDTGLAREIELGGASLPSGDGIRLHGRTLYVVQNFLNQVAVVELSPGFMSGAVVNTITSALFDVPTTAARFRDRLYLVNGRFDDAFPPVFGAPPVTLEYNVVAVRP